MAQDRKKKARKDRSAMETAAMEAAMALAGRDGWSGVTLSTIAEEAGITLGDLRTIAVDKTDILRLFLRRIDAEVLAEDGGYTDEDSVRDRLFDLLMRRFDALEPYKAGVTSAFRAVTRDPVATLVMAPEGMRALGWYLDAAGVGTDGAAGLLRIKGLSAVWLSALRVWFDDDSADLEKTMKALDTALARAERAARWIDGGRRRRTVQAEAPPESEAAEAERKGGDSPDSD